MSGFLPARAVVPLPESVGSWRRWTARVALTVAATAAMVVAASVDPTTSGRPTGAPVVVTRPASPLPSTTQETGAPHAEPGTRHDTGPGHGRPVPPEPTAQPLAPVPPADRRDAPDPFVLADGDGFVLYTTQVGLHNVPVATSPDLRRWSPPRDALPRLPSWAAFGRTWAPGVARLGGGYRLYFAAHDARSGRQCIGVASGVHAAGPFTSGAPEPLVCQVELGGSIDPHPFVDRDGTVYLLWKADGNAIGRPSTLFAAVVSADGLALASRPVPLLTSGETWETPLIENPALIATGRTYVLLYSGGWWASAGYAIGYAVCDSPLGGCTKRTVDVPLLASGGDEAGPGGASVVTGPAGDRWLAYHAWARGRVGYDDGGARSLRFAALMQRDGRPAVAR